MLGVIFLLTTAKIETDKYKLLVSGRSPQKLDRLVFELIFH